MRRSRALFACAVASALMLAAPAAANSQEAAAPQAITKVKIVDFAFQPATVTVTAGTTVGWKNFGAVSHTSTSNDGRWNSGTSAGRPLQDPFRSSRHLRLPLRHPYVHDGHRDGDAGLSTPESEGPCCVAGLIRRSAVARPRCPVEDGVRPAAGLRPG